MSRVVRAFLVWVVVITLPLQGMAASLMLFCGPSHERAMHALVADAAAARPAHVEHGEHHDVGAGHAAPHHASHDHAVASQPAADVDADVVADHSGNQRVHHGKVSCSVCAACCSAVALPSSFSVPEALRAAHTMQTSPSVPVASRQPDGPDRPPRPVHA